MHGRLSGTVGFWYSLNNKMLGMPKFDFVGLNNYISILQNTRRC